MGVSAADVPGRFDCVLDGFGYLTADPQDIKAEFGYTPTFVTRQNVQGDWGDNQQEFWLTATQRDWSEGEQQRYFRQGDEDSVRRFWQGSAIDVVSLPGQVSLRNTAQTSTAAAVPAVIGMFGQVVDMATSTNLYGIDTNATLTDQGAHGLGTTPTGIAGDEQRLYLTGTGIGTVGVRKWTGSAFSTFSGTAATALALLNNTLYGYRNSAGNGDLIRYDSAGTSTSLFTWKSGDGTVLLQTARLKAFGGKLLILRDLSGSVLPSELWIYDGTAPTKVWELQPNFQPGEMCVSAGTVFIAGMLTEGARYRPAIFYYANGSVGLLWKATSTVSSSAIGGITNFADGLVFNDPSQNKLLFYSTSLGGIHPVAAWNTPSANERFANYGGGGGVIAGINGTTTIQTWPSATTVSSGTITTSLFDYDSSLDKRFHALRIDFDSATDGNGGTVDVAYRLNDPDGSYTSLATGITSGQEISLTNIKGRSISVKVTLNKGTSTLGPVLKRIAVRATAIAPGLARGTHILNCTGNKDRDPQSLIQLRDGSRHNKDGLQMATDLGTAARASNPVSMTDIFGTKTVVVDADNFKLQQVRPGEFIAIVPWRQVV